jgi:hypothetical protein
VDDVASGTEALGVAEDPGGPDGVRLEEDPPPCETVGAAAWSPVRGAGWTASERGEDAGGGVPDDTGSEADPVGPAVEDIGEASPGSRPVPAKTGK